MATLLTKPQGTTMIGTNHSIEQLRAKIQVMMDKTIQLEEYLNRTQEEVNIRLDDIRALAGDIYNDRENRK